MSLREYGTRAVLAAASVMLVAAATPSATAPRDAAGFDVRLTGFRIAFDVSINGKLVGRLRDDGAEASVTRAVKPGLNTLHVHWFSLGQPSAGSLAVRASDASGTFRTFLSVRKYPLSDAEADRDFTFVKP